LETTACFGTCPEFVLTIFAGGDVEFVGSHCVIRMGISRGKLTPEAVTRLEKAVAGSPFWQLSPKCCICREETDHPWTYLEVSRAGTDDAKTIRHYHGCLSAPAGLTALEDAILTETGAIKWIGSREERRAKRWKTNKC
jgi:hypothetical protein